MTQATPALTGFDIAQAANATRALLDRLLEREGVSFESFAIMGSVTRAGGEAPISALAAVLPGGAARVNDLVARAEGEGFVFRVGPGSASERVALSAEGAQRQREVQTAAAAITAQLQAGMDAGEMATARRVLLELTERATAQLAG